MKTRKLTWTPVRRGETYCSSACGAGCTRKQYLQAKAAANACLKRMDNPKLWKVELNENMGWFWRLAHIEGHMKVSGGQLPYKQDPSKYFYCELNSTRDGGGTDACWHDNERFNDPNKAVRHRLKIAKAHVRKLSIAIRKCSVV